MSHNRTMATLTSFDLLLLRGVVRTIDEHASIDLAEFEDEADKKYWAAEQRLAQQSISWVHLPWFLAKDDITPSDATQASRSWRRLEKLGYIERIEFPNSNRTAQIELLPEGRTAAATITAAPTRTPVTRVQAFLADRCELIDGGEVERRSLYCEFIEWSEAKGTAPASLASFEQQLMATPSIGRVHRQTGERAFGQSFYTGIRLRDSLAA